MGKELADAFSKRRRPQGHSKHAQRVESDRSSESLADACGDRLEGREPVRQARSASSHKRRGGELGNADSARRAPTRSGRSFDAGQQPESRYGELGDANGGRCEGERVEERARKRSARGHEPDRHDPHGRFFWPPGPQDAEGWRHYLAAGGPAPAFSKLRGSSDGIPAGMEFRADRLRCLGNGVVPQTAELAWLTLKARLEQE